MHRLKQLISSHNEFIYGQRFLDVNIKGAKAKFGKLIYDRVPSGMVHHGTNT